MGNYLVIGNVTTRGNLGEFMRVTITKDYNDFKKGDVVDVDERTARNLFKLKAATVDKMERTKTDRVIIHTSPSVEVQVAKTDKKPRKSLLKRIFKG